MKANDPNIVLLELAAERYHRPRNPRIRAASARPLQDRLRGHGAALRAVQAHEHRPRSAQGRDPRQTGTDDPLNRTRADFAEKFEALIERYNAGSATIEALYAELLALSKSFNDEQQRHARENMSEEELVIFDILTRPAPELTTEERAEVKKVARELLTRLKTLLVLDWRQKSTARSRLKLTIEDTLDTGLPRAYTPELYRQKCAAVFEHVTRATRNGMRVFVRWSCKEAVAHDQDWRCRRAAAALGR